MNILVSNLPNHLAKLICNREIPYAKQRNKINRTHQKTFLREVRKHQLVVFNYESSGTLELLSLDIPFIYITARGRDCLQDTYIPYYQLLLEANIAFDDPIKASNHITAIFDNIDGWWMSDKVVEAKNIFRHKFARYEPRPVESLSLIFKQLCNSSTYS